MQQIHEELRSLLSGDSIKHLVLDFGAVEFFDANLRGVLVWASRELTKRGGRLVLSALPEGMRDHPTIVWFGRELMTIVDGPDEALRLLSPPVEGGAGRSPA